MTLISFVFPGAVAVTWAASEPVAPKAFRAELLEPGRTPESALKELLGKPHRRVQESPSRQYYFYELGGGSTMDATVFVRSGVVEYVSYICDESLGEVREKFSGEPSITRRIGSASNGLSSVLTQVIYEGKGRGYVYEPKSQKIRACVAWAPGKKFDEIGR